uniref:Condensin-2 complex subunit H2 n=1 Tax=Cricetulus griseus TaxID=10029 RepID=A0A8C2LIZ6_CRIGR
MENVEVRFTHLLQPIWGLTKNWEELDQICKTTMDFIEAALLIQGSACVYSKKVEYLYSLVYQALDFISGKRQEDGSNRAVNSGTPYETEDELLSMDDFPDSQANVDLKNDQASSELLIITLLPMALVVPDEVEKNNSPLYSCQGEVLASLKDFRMNTCTPNPRGYFMLDPVGMCPVEPAGVCPMPRSQKDIEGAEEQPMEASRNRSPVPVLPEGPVLSNGDEDAEDVAELPEVALEPVERRTSQRYMLQEHQGALEPASQLQEIPDPWQSLDLFDSLGSKLFQKGKPNSVPPRVEEPPGQKHKRKGAAKLQDFHQWYLAAYADHADSRRPQQKGLTFADMEVLYWKHVKEQLEKFQRCKMTERWMPRAKEDLWPVEEERLEDSLEDLGVADDFLEPEDYAEPEGVVPGKAADLDAEAMPEGAGPKNVQCIRDWKDTIQPLLQEQELHQLNEWCPFAELVVCCSMLASFQLANDYMQPGLEDAVDTMSLRLLTHQ